MAKETEEVRSEGKVEVKIAKPERAAGITWYEIGYDILKENMLNVRPSDIEDLKEDAKDWWNSEETKNSWYGKMLHQVLGHWAAKTAMLVGKVFADNWFYNFINRVDEDVEDEDDDDRRDDD